MENEEPIVRLCTKLDIIQSLEDGQTVRELSRDFDLNEDIIEQIWWERRKTKQKIRRAKAAKRKKKIKRREELEKENTEVTASIEDYECFETIQFLEKNLMDCERREDLLSALYSVKKDLQENKIKEGLFSKVFT
ncbi:unnamed protein product [Dimorphilus gyrociliatus]|uniref:Uncharacterized protein n=1 Tax=Dimorphilus gyrociliatus TaxID=2664684 RepID=A0A7I8WBH3_9ANNE|nr:unnamed protein product [Dimorphilus gyrociliatus]